MRLLMFYADYFFCNPTVKTLDTFPDRAEPVELHNSILAFIQVEPKDLDDPKKSVTRLIKNIKWLMKKNNTKSVALHSFAHLGIKKADPEQAYVIFENAFNRLENSGYSPVITPYGYFNDLKMNMPGKSIARVFKKF